MKKYSGFTLIEMLIVMGIIIILMAAGIAGGRFALQRANRIQKQSAVDNIEQALWGYYSDKRQFPAHGLTPEDLMTDELSEYVDAGQFDGGADGDFAYWVTGNQQEFVVCTTLGGFADVGEHGIYCTGNGLDEIDVFTAGGSVPLPSDMVFEHDVGQHGAVWNDGDIDWAQWHGETRDWTGP